MRLWSAQACLRFQRGGLPPHYEPTHEWLLRMIIMITSGAAATPANRRFEGGGKPLHSIFLHRTH
ncbi:MAG: hypothetical protein ACYCZF_00065 [Anaerolineae bacterium]